MHLQRERRTNLTATARPTTSPHLDAHAAKLVVKAGVGVGVGVEVVVVAEAGHAFKRQRTITTMNLRATRRLRH